MPENVVQTATEALIPWLGRQWMRVWFHDDPLLRTTAPLPPSRRPVDADPVIIVMGLADTYYGGKDWRVALERDGFEVFQPDLPYGGSVGVELNAQYLAQYVEWVKKKTGRSRVHLVGHSQGPLTIRWYMKFMGGTPNVASVTGVTTPSHGVRTMWGPKGYELIGKIPLLGRTFQKTVGAGTRELFEGSAMLTKLNAGDETPGSELGIPFTTLYSADFDGNVEPWSPPLDGSKNIAMERERHFIKLRGPNHAYAAHSSVEVYERLREALLAAHELPAPMVDAKAGARRVSRRARPRA